MVMQDVQQRSLTVPSVEDMKLRGYNRCFLDLMAVGGIEVVNEVVHRVVFEQRHKTKEDLEGLGLTTSDVFFQEVCHFLYRLLTYWIGWNFIIHVTSVTFNMIIIMICFNVSDPD